MTLRLVLLTVFVFGCVVQPLSVNASDRPTWSDRGVFVFGPIVLDFRFRLEVLGPLVSQLEDCSNANYYCADAQIVAVALPRRCADTSDIRVGKVWQIGKIATEVLSLYRVKDFPRDPHSRGRGTKYLLGSRLRPNLVFEYEPLLGVTVLYYDVTEKRNLVEMARKDDFRAALGRLVDIERHEFDLLTLDPFGSCHH